MRKLKRTSGKIVGKLNYIVLVEIKFQYLQ